MSYEEYLMNRGYLSALDGVQLRGYFVDSSNPEQVKAALLVGVAEQDDIASAQREMEAAGEDGLVALARRLPGWES